MVFKIQKVVYISITNSEIILQFSAVSTLDLVDFDGNSQTTFIYTTFAHQQVWMIQSMYACQL